MVYGMASVGPRKVWWPPTWPLISCTTSAARLVLSSTNPPTKSACMVMKRASPHTTMSFMPMDRKLIPNGKADGNDEISPIFDPYCETYFALQSKCTKKYLSLPRGHSACQGISGFFLGY